MRSVAGNALAMIKKIDLHFFHLFFLTPNTNIHVRTTTYRHTQTMSTSNLARPACSHPHIPGYSGATGLLQYVHKQLPLCDEEFCSGQRAETLVGGDEEKSTNPTRGETSSHDMKSLCSAQSRMK